MTAVAGTFVKFDAVPTRKVVRISIEVPIEKADETLRKLGGYPDPSNARWVGIAPLKDQPAENAMKGGKLAQAAGILCAEKAFQKWCHSDNAEEAADYVRIRCGIESRAHLDHDQEAARLFREMRLEYETWLKVGE